MNPTQSRRCFFFDLDGTLIDSLPGIEHSVRAAFAACNLPMKRTALRGMIGPPIRTILSRVGEIEDAQILSELERAFRANYDNEGWRKTACYPAADFVLRALREKGSRLFVISNKPRHIALKILTAVGLFEVFESVLTLDSRLPPYTGKNEMISTLVTTEHLSPQRCYMAGDTIEDAKAAAANGVRFIYMTHGYGDIPADASEPVAYRVDDFMQLLPEMAKEFAHD